MKRKSDDTNLNALEQPQKYLRQEISEPFSAKDEQSDGEVSSTLKVAVVGCCHGKLDDIYNSIRLVEENQKQKVDLLLICGDFQAIRTIHDLNSMSVPNKYKELGSFYKYFNGTSVAPVLTIFIGGNHEASNYSLDLPFGGWAAPNIYYMGFANILQFGGLRIGGLSGIFKDDDYRIGHYEQLPFNERSMRSVYHMRQIEVFKMLQVNSHLDIILSHDWPRGISKYGDIGKLLSEKPYFDKEISENTLGNPACENLLHILQPSYWFSAHLHVKFPAIIKHDQNKTTKFLALDKCLPGKKFLQVIDIPVQSKPFMAPKVLCYDPEWLAILRSTNQFDLRTKEEVIFPIEGGKERYDFQPTDQEIQEIRDLFKEQFVIPDNFQQDYPAGENPQTNLLCKTLGLRIEKP